MSNDDKILESLIAGGVIGAALGALLSKDKDDNTTLGALAGAVILATYRASENARQLNAPVYIEEDGKLYEIQPGGIKRFIKNIPRPHIAVSKNFKLK